MKEFILKLLNFAINEYKIVDEQAMKQLKAEINDKITKRIAEVDIDAIMAEIDIETIIEKSLKTNANLYLKASINDILKWKFQAVANNSDIKNAFGKSIKDSILSIVKTTKE